MINWDRGAAGCLSFDIPGGSLTPRDDTVATGRL